MSGTLGKIKGKNLTIKSKEAKWFKAILEKILNGNLPFDNARVSYRSNSEWVKVTFWCKILKLKKEELEDGSSKAKGFKG